MIRFLTIIFFLMSSLYAGSLTLINDSKYELQVSVEGNDGTEFEPIIIAPGETKKWSDQSYGHSRFNKENQKNNKSGSVTPYSITWRLAKDEQKDLYSECRKVRSGATVTANHCKSRSS